MASLGESAHQDVPITVPPGGTGNRRMHLRKRGLAYVDFGAGNAGIVSNLSECGLAFNGIGIVEKGRTFAFRFTMPGRSSFIEATGEVVWLSESQKSGGLTFVELAEEVRSEIRAWTSASPVSAEAPENITFASPQRPKPSAEMSMPGLQDASAARVDRTAANGSAESSQDEGAKVRFELPITSIQAEGQSVPVPSGVPQTGAVPQPQPPRQAEAEPQKWVVAAAPIKSSQPEAEPGTSLGKPEIVPDRPTPAPAGSLKGVDSAPPKNSRYVADEIEQSPLPKQPDSSTSRAIGRTGPTAESRTLNQMDMVDANPAFQSVALRTSKARAEQNEKLGPALTTQKPSAPGLTTASPKRADEQRKSDRAAVLSRAAQQRQIIKNSQLLRFVAGVAVGCVVLATIAGGLVATGRLRLIDPYSAASSNALSAAEPGDSKPGFESTKPDDPAQGTLAGTPAESASENAQPGTPISTPSAKSSSNRDTVPPTLVTPKPTQRPSAVQRPERSTDAAKTSPSEGARSAPLYSTDSNAEKPAGLELPVLVTYIDPVYPPAARAANLEGNVEVLATIGRDGIPSSLKLVSGDPQLGAAAIAAISNWRYRPATLNGQFEESLITIVVKFAL